MPLSILKTIRTSATHDTEARKAALTAVDDMMRGASRSADLLSQAQAATVNGMYSPQVGLQRASMLANQAYRERTNAEVAKYRAMFALAAEDAGNKSVSWGTVAARAQDARTHAAAIEKSNYHRVQRDLMVDAANATANALKAVPPLPLVGPQLDTQDDMYRAVETPSKPSWGWRPKLYRELMGSFYPADVRRAAGGLQGMGDGRFGDTSAPSDAWDALLNAFGHGVQATGEAAAQEGNKVAASNPSGGAIIGTAGNILAALTRMMGIKGNAATNQPASTDSPFPWIPVVGGVAALGVGYILFKHFK